MQWDELFSEVREYQPGQATIDLPAGGGVYLLTDGQDRLIQLASSADLRRAILHRLFPQRTEENQTGKMPVPHQTTGEMPVPHQTTGKMPVPRKADLSQIVRRIRWRPTHSVFEATYEYYRIARIILPRDYLDNVAFGSAWFVHADPAAAIPRLTVGKQISSAPGVTLGPFATQPEANRFVQVLEDVFDLCRYVHILEQAPRGQACAYFEMGRCPAPCNGSIPMAQYRGTIAAALRFAAGQREEARATWEQMMRDAAGRLEFEKAAAIKQRLDRAGDLKHAAYRYVRSIDEFSWLIIQRGGGRTRVKPFFVRRGWIEARETVKLRDLERVAPQWLKHMQAVSADTAAGGMPSQGRLSEQVWLVSHFLFRRERMGLFLHVGELGEPADWVDRVRREFGVARPAPDAPSTSAENTAGAGQPPAGGI